MGIQRIHGQLLHRELHVFATPVCKVPIICIHQSTILDIHDGDVVPAAQEYPFLVNQKEKEKKKENAGSDLLSELVISIVFSLFCLSTVIPLLYNTPLGRGRVPSVVSSGRFLVQGCSPFSPGRRCLLQRFSMLVCIL